MWCDRALLLQSQGRHQEASSSYLQSIHYRPNLAGKSIVRVFSFPLSSMSSFHLLFITHKFHSPFSIYRYLITFGAQTIAFVWYSRGLSYIIPTRVNAHHLRNGQLYNRSLPTGRCRKHSLQWAFPGSYTCTTSWPTSFVRRLGAPGGDGCGCWWSWFIAYVIGWCPNSPFSSMYARVIRQSYTQGDVETAQNFPRIKRRGPGIQPAIMERDCQEWTGPRNNDNKIRMPIYSGTWDAQKAQKQGRDPPLGIPLEGACILRNDIPIGPTLYIYSSGKSLIFDRPAVAEKW